MIIIGICGAAGAMLRMYISNYSIAKNRAAFPLGTFVINSVGSLLLGILFALQASNLLTNQLWNEIGVGFLGAFTTFSTFSYEWILFIRNKQYGYAARYVGLTLLLGIIMAALGYFGMETFLV